MEQNPELESNLKWMMERWRAPAGIALEAELGEYRRVLGKYPQADIRRALERLKETKSGREWPAPASILDHLPMQDRQQDNQPTPDLIARLTQMNAAEFKAWHGKQLSAPFTEGWHALRREAVAMAWPMARMAAEEGWIGALADYSVKHGQPPDSRDIPKLKRYAELLRAEISAQTAQPIGSIGRMILLRYRRLACGLGLSALDAERIYA
jgi:hypothetical protein